MVDCILKLMTIYDDDNCRIHYDCPPSCYLDNHLRIARKCCCCYPEACSTLATQPLSDSSKSSPKPRIVSCLVHTSLLRLVVIIIIVCLFFIVVHRLLHVQPAIPHILDLYALFLTLLVPCRCGLRKTSSFVFP